VARWLVLARLEVGRPRVLSADPAALKGFRGPLLRPPDSLDASCCATMSRPLLLCARSAPVAGPSRQPAGAVRSDDVWPADLGECALELAAPPDDRDDLRLVGDVARLALRSAVVAAAELACLTAAAVAVRLVPLAKRGPQGNLATRDARQTNKDGRAKTIGWLCVSRVIGSGSAGRAKFRPSVPRTRTSDEIFDSWNSKLPALPWQRARRPGRRHRVWPARAAVI
jgi:hypothetical protein